MAGHHKLRHCFKQAHHQGTTGLVIVEFTSGELYALDATNSQVWQDISESKPTEQHAGSRFNAQWFVPGVLGPDRAQGTIFGYAFTRISKLPSGITETCALGDHSDPPTNSEPGCSASPGIW